MKKQLTRYSYWWLLFALFLLEGSLLPLLLPEVLQSSIHMSPHLVLLGVLFLGVLTHRYYGLATGIGFGLLQDITYYGHMIGVQAFAMGLCGYAVGLLPVSGRRPITSVIAFILVGLGLYELVIYWIYTLFQVTRLPFERALVTIMLPSMLMNVLFAFGLYVPLRNLLQQFRASGEEKED